MSREPDDMTARLEALRDLLQGSLDAARWEELCATFDRWPDGAALDVGLAYAREHLTAWPDALRVAPVVWLAAGLRGEPQPRLVLARKVHIFSSELNRFDALQALLGSGALGELRRLALPFCRLDAAAAAWLARCERLGALEELNLCGNPIGLPGVRALAESPLLAGLQKLELDGCGLDLEAAAVLAASTTLSPAVRAPWQARLDAEAAERTQLQGWLEQAQAVEAPLAEREDAARQLWRKARSGRPLPTPLGAALAELVASAPPAVGFFAALARRWDEQRRGGSPLTPLRDPEGAPDISAEERSSYNTWYSCSWAARFGDVQRRLPPVANQRAECGVCGSALVHRIHSDGFGSNAGGYDCDEFACDECRCFTLREHEWG